jgi:hypothetical protein
MNLQVTASPDGDILWVSGALPGPTRATRGSTHAKVPYKGEEQAQSQKDANDAHARLRSPGARANAQLKTCRILRKLRCCPDAPDSTPRPSVRYFRGDVETAGSAPTTH